MVLPMCPSHMVELLCLLGLFILLMRESFGCVVWTFFGGVLPAHPVLIVNGKRTWLAVLEGGSNLNLKLQLELRLQPLRRRQHVGFHLYFCAIVCVDMQLHMQTTSRQWSTGMLLVVTHSIKAKAEEEAACCVGCQGNISSVGDK